MDFLVGTKSGLWATHRGNVAPISPKSWAVTDVAVLASGDVLIGRADDAPARLRDGEWQTVELPTITSWGYHRETPDIVWAGAVPAAIWVSRDGGESWSECSSLHGVPGRDSWWVPEPPHHPAVLDLDFSPANPDVVYAAVEDVGILRTRDGGRRWKQLEGGVYATVHTILVHPRETGVVFAATGSGFFRTDDGGFYWHRLVDGIRRLHLIPALLLPGESREDDVLLTAGAIGDEVFWDQPEGARAVLYRSEDWGESWYPVGHGIGMDLRGMITALAGTGDIVVAGSSDGCLWRSGDRGENWEPMAEGLPPVTALEAMRTGD